jgi:hypothetical protein
MSVHSRAGKLYVYDSQNFHTQIFIHRLSGDYRVQSWMPFEHDRTLCLDPDTLPIISPDGAFDNSTATTSNQPWPYYDHSSNPVSIPTRQYQGWHQRDCAKHMCQTTNASFLMMQPDLQIYKHSMALTARRGYFHLAMIQRNLVSDEHSRLVARACETAPSTPDDWSWEMLHDTSPG